VKKQIANQEGSIAAAKKRKISLEKKVEVVKEYLGSTTAAF